MKIQLRPISTFCVTVIFASMYVTFLILKGYMNISFDNSKTECDFLAYKNGKAYGFQVCYELNDMNLKRELYGFELENVMLEKKTLLTYNQKETYGDIEVVPFWEWVMSPPFT